MCSDVPCGQSAQCPLTSPYSQPHSNFRSSTSSTSLLFAPQVCHLLHLHHRLPCFIHTYNIMKFSVIFPVCHTPVLLISVLLCLGSDAWLRFESTVGGTSRPLRSSSLPTQTRVVLRGRVGGTGPGQSQQSLNDFFILPVRDLTSHLLPLSIPLSSSICRCQCYCKQWQSGNHCCVIRGSDYET